MTPRAADLSAQAGLRQPPPRVHRGASGGPGALPAGAILKSVSLARQTPAALQPQSNARGEFPPCARNSAPASPRCPPHAQLCLLVFDCRARAVAHSLTPTHTPSHTPLHPSLSDPVRRPRSTPHTPSHPTPHTPLVLFAALLRGACAGFVVHVNFVEADLGANNEP